jgi:putative GTP pyrophosphokinase
MHPSWLDDAMEARAAHRALRDLSGSGGSPRTLDHVTTPDGPTIPRRRTSAAPMLTARAQQTLDTLDEEALSEMRALRDETERFMMRYKFGMDEVITKLTILREEFNQAHDYNPIEHISSRLKSLESVVAKMERKGVAPSFDAIGDTITDIAGVRVTCSFVSDAYRIFELLTAQPDLRLLTVKDYIANPKPNGYQSLHAIVEVPVFLSTGEHPVAVEVQIRTIAMDFWASLEHKIYYKYDRQVPAALLEQLTDAARTASELDGRMESLHRQVHGMPKPYRAGLPI